MRIVFFIDHLRADGTQHFLRQLVAGLAARGHVLAIVCLNDSWDQVVVDDIRRNGADIRVVGRRALVGVYGMVTTLIWLRTRRFDALVTLLFTSDVLGRLFGRLAGVGRVITSIRSRNQHYTALQRVLVRLTMPLADVVVLNGAHAHDFAIHVEGARPERIRLIPNGIDIVHAPILATNGLCSLLNLPASSRLVGSLGRLSYEKGHDQLVAAFALLGDQSVHLVLIGDGNEREQLRLQAELLGIAARVHFIGQRQDAKELISDLAVFVHPSRQEGMSNALLEAMAAGRPIVATAIDGNRELMSDGVHGWLVPLEDPDALAQAIASALGNPTEAQQRGMAAQARAAQAFSMSAMVDAWERVLQS